MSVERLLFTPVALATVFIAATADYVSAKMPTEFHGLWLSDSAQECPAGNNVDFMNFAAGGAGLYVDGSNYVSTESECTFNGTPKKSCCDSETSQTVSSAFQCGNSKGKVLLHVEIDNTKPILVEAYENVASGPNVTIYRKQCVTTK